VRDVPRVRARHPERDEVTGTHQRDGHIPRQDVLGRAQLANRRYVLIHRHWAGPVVPPRSHRKYGEWLVMSLGCRGAQMVRTARHHHERLAVAALHVEDPRHVPAAVRGHRPAGLDPQRLTRPRRRREPAPVSGPVEPLAGPCVVHRHAAAQVEFRVPHAVPVAPRPGEIEHPRRGGEQRGRVKAAGQMRVHPAQPQAASCRVTRRKPARALVKQHLIHAKRRWLTPHDKPAGHLRWVGPGEVDPEQHVDGAVRLECRGAEQAQLVRALHVEAERARLDGGGQFRMRLARSAEREVAARDGQ
jgi:hypothetical protein